MKNKPDYLTDNDWKLLTNKYKNMDKVLKKLSKNYPVQYLIGNVNFYGYEFLVNKHVLIPRFETEGLLEETIKYINKYNLTDTFVLDIGTGTGCIPITLKKELPDLKITSIDISNKALKVASKNAKLNKVDINFINKSIFKYKPINKYGVIISNPPYIDKSLEVDPQIKYEPASAIFAKDSGLVFYKYIIANAKKMLLKRSIIAFEIGFEQGKILKKIAKEEFPSSRVKVEKDLSGKDRYLFIITE